MKCCTAYTCDVFTNVPALRRRKPASLCIDSAAATNAAELLSPASGHVQQMAEHELVDMGSAARDAANPAGKRGPKTKSVSTPRGVCGFEDCPIRKGVVTALTKCAQYFCGSCKGGKDSYYHLGCFFKCHKCLKA